MRHSLSADLIAARRHVVRYASAHAWTWPEHVRTRRTLDRTAVQNSTVRRSTESFGRPLNAEPAAVVTLQQVRRDRGSVLCSSADRLMARAPPAASSTITHGVSGHSQHPPAAPAAVAAAADDDDDDDVTRGTTLTSCRCARHSCTC